MKAAHHGYRVSLVGVAQGQPADEGDDQHSKGATQYRAQQAYDGTVKGRTNVGTKGHHCKPCQNAVTTPDRVVSRQGSQQAI